MSNKIFGIASFAAGAIFGALAAWSYAKEKYARISQEEIASVKAAFSEKKVQSEASGASDVIEENPQPSEESPDISQYTGVLQQTGYTPGKESSQTDAPYVISPEEFGEFDDYETIDLIFYADGILADDNDDLVEDLEEVVGFSSLTHFGEFEEDTVFVRNDRLKCDFEILRDQRSYKDAIEGTPRSLEEA